MFSDLTYIAVVVLVPLIPAFLLYKFLPSGRTEVGGPFKGLDIKLSGAFAGYFLVVLIVTSLLVFLIKQKPEEPCPKVICPTPPATQYVVYTVTGKVDLEGDSNSQKIDPKQLDFSIQPPERTVNPNGSFSLQIPVRPDQEGELEFPYLIVGHKDQNYSPVTIHLKEKAPNEQQVTVEYNRAARTIMLKPAIRLTYGPPRPSRPQAIATPEP